MQDPTSPFPFRTRFETGIASHQVRQIRMELIFGAHVEFESVEQGDERLKPPSHISFMKNKGGVVVKKVLAWVTSATDFPVSPPL